MGKTSGRGSYKLYSDLSPTKAKKLQSALSGWKIIDWHELGTPNPEVIIGTVQSGVANFAKNVATLISLKELRDLNILINGIPRPDIAQIKFTLRG